MVAKDYLGDMFANMAASEEDSSVQNLEQTSRKSESAAGEKQEEGSGEEYTVHEAPNSEGGLTIFNQGLLGKIELKLNANSNVRSWDTESDSAKFQYFKERCE